MAEYICREAVEKAIDNVYTDLYPDYVPNSIAAFRECLLVDIGIIPEADVQPVKRGKWEGVDYDTFFKCSECGHMTDWQRYKYCPYCGARMDGGTNG